MTQVFGQVMHIDTKLVPIFIAAFLQWSHFKTYCLCNNIRISPFSGLTKEVSVV